MKIKNIFTSLLLTSLLFLPSCNNNVEELEIELDEFTPLAYVGKEYDFTDVLYVEDGVNYQLEVYYQNYKTMEEKTLPVEDTFYFTPVEPFDLTVIVYASKGSQTAQRTRIVRVSLNPEDATRNNLEMCNFESGNWRGTGSRAEISYSEVCGENSKTSRRISFKNSWDLPDEEDIESPATVNASFNLATTAGLGVDAGIDAKKCILSFDIKMSEEFYNSNNLNRNMFSLKIEDNDWIPFVSILYLVDDISEFTLKNTNNGWLHVEQNLYETGDFDDLGDGTYVITLGFYGISKETRETSHVYLDNISLVEIPVEDLGERETASRYNIEMCHYEGGNYRGTGSKAETSYTELYGEESTSSRKITFAYSKDLPDVVEDDNNATVNASFNLANTRSIGVDNEIDAKNCTLEFDIKLSQEFFNTIHPYKHMFSIKIEDETWVPFTTWISFVNDPNDFSYENTDNGWLHVSYDLSTNIELAELGSSTYVITFGFFGITNTTRETASAVFDNISLISNS